MNKNLKLVVGLSMMCAGWSAIVGYVACYYGWMKCENEYETILENRNAEIADREAYIQDLRAKNSALKCENAFYVRKLNQAVGK